MQDSKPTSETPRNLSGRHLFLGLSGLVLVLLGTTVPLRGQPDVPRHLVLDPVVETKLQLLAGGLHTEIVLCLHGIVERDSARVTDFTMPEPRLSTFQRSRFLPCSKKALGVWHNHPLVEVATTVAGHPGRSRDEVLPVRPRDLCALSGKDITTSARLGHSFTVVAVDSATWCWWTRDQVQQLVRQKATQGRQLPGQGSS